MSDAVPGKARDGQGQEESVKRSFKAATVFAGVGAATGMFAPAALAAPAHTTTVAKPDIGPARECLANNGGVSTWVHLYYPNNDHPAECIGGAGTLAINATIRSFCPGNNNGFASGAVPISFSHSGVRGNLGFNDHLSLIHISNWTGHNKCT